MLQGSFISAVWVFAVVWGYRCLISVVGIVYLLLFVG